MTRSLKVLSYNIHKGFNAGKRRFILDGLRDAIRSIHADLVVLQEVQGGHSVHRRRIKNWPDEPQFEYLADTIWPHYAYGKNAVYDAGHHGNAILSKFPFEFWENIDITTFSFQRRGMLHGVIQVPGRDSPHVHALCVHLDLLEAGRRDQVEKIVSRILEAVPDDAPLVVAGDFNDWRQRASKPLLRELRLKECFLELHGKHARSFPSWLPALKLDRIYYRGLTLKNAHCLNIPPWSTLSDHTPLLVEFGW